MRTEKHIYVWYWRVSSVEQAARKLSIPSQIEQIKNHAKHNEIIVEKIYQERQSAFKWSRPQFKKMIEYIESNKHISGIIVFKYDRLSRNIDDFAIIDRLMRTKNIEIVSVSEPMFNSYLWRYMLRDMQNRAILYSEELSFRVKLWMRKKLQQWWARWGNPPFWFSVINWYYIADKEKAPIVRFIFDQYESSIYGAKRIAKMVREKYWLKTFRHKRVETMIKNTMYVWRETIKRKLSSAEYMFRWVDKPWIYYEEYDSKYITPLISEEQFLKCNEIRKLRWSIYPKTSGKARYPKIFQCVCGRNLRRDDKKNIKYLSCTKQINNVFPAKCTEWYTQLKTLEPELEKILRRIIHTIEIREKMRSDIHKRITKDSKWNRKEIQQNLEKIHEYNKRLDELTDSFVEQDIDKNTYSRSAKKIQEKVKVLEWEIKTLENNKEYILAGKKAIKLIDMMDERESLLNEKNDKQKSSQLFSLIFKCIANLSVGGWKPFIYKYYKLFEILDFDSFSLYWALRDSNPGPSA